jgi:hypothetical protein
LIQAVMIFALGLLTAGLIALLVTPAIWRRAMRLTRARIEASLPMTRSEISAEKDQIRAGFAIANRRLEMDAGRLKEKLTAELIEVSRKRDEVARLERDKAELAATITTLEARAAELGAELGGADQRLADVRAEVAARDLALAERASALEAVEARLARSEQANEEQRL